MYKDNSNKNFNKDHKKDWRKKPNNLPKNITVEIPVSCYGITLDGKEYNGATFIDMMEDLQNNDTFSKISIPINMKASYTTGNPEARWNIVVGHIRSFDEMGNATVVIHAKSIKFFENIQNPIIVPRVAIKQGACVCIIGLDIVEESDIKK